MSETTETEPKPTFKARLAQLHRDARHLEIDMEEGASADALYHMRRAVSALGRAADVEG